MPGSDTPGSALLPSPVGVEIDLLRRRSIQVLASVAVALEAAAKERRSLLDEVHGAEHTLLGLVREREVALASLAVTRAQLNEAEMQLELTRAQRVSIVSELEQLLSAGLVARVAMQPEVVSLEHRRSELAATVAEAPLPSTNGHLPVTLPGVVGHSPAPAPTLRSDAQRATAVLAASVAVAAPVGDASHAAVVPKTELPDSIVAELTALLDGLPQPAGVPRRENRLDPQAGAGAALFVATLRSMVRAGVRAVGTHLKPLSRPTVPNLGQLATASLVVLLLGLALLLTPMTQVFGGLQLLAVMSGSMEPTIPVGGIVGIRPVPATDLKVGNIITFVNQSNPDVLVTHRVVSLDVRDGQTMLTTKGDANDSVDALSAPASRAVGRVDFSLAYLGYLMVWLSSPLAKIAIVGLAVLGLGLTSIQRSNPPVTPPVGPPPEPATDANSYIDYEREIKALLGR